jgi:2-methylcitrate dehydratase
VATEAFAAYASGIRFSDLDAATVTKAKHRVLDLIGCAIGGAPAAGNAGLVDLLQAKGGRPEATVIGYKVKGPASEVAMTNAVISRAYDFEVMTVVVDGQQVASHHSPTTCMTALALAERDKLSGKDFLAALVMGDDICARMLAASGLDFGQGWDGAPIYSTIGAVAIAANLMRLTPQQTQDAFGLSVDTIAGTVQNIWDGATDWKLPQGLAARNGVFAAELAKRGWVGVADALNAPYGFYAQYTAGCAKPEVLTKALGKAFWAEEYFNPFPACAATHPTIECALAMRENNKLKASDIQRWTIRIAPAGLNVFVSKPFEARRYAHCDANFSHQWQAANALVHGAILQQHYENGAITHPEVMALVERSTLAALPPGKTGFEIEVVTNDGRTLVERHAGRPSKNPAEKGSSYADLVAKFRQQVAFSGFVPTRTADEIIKRIDRLEDEPDMAAFVRLLARHQYKVA